MSSLKCWLCKTNSTNPQSFTECNANKGEQTCGSKFPPACGIFVFRSTQSGALIHAKSCVWEKDCGSNDTFCSGINLGGADCRLQCCDQELCNYEEEFKSTTPLPNTLPDTTPKTTTEKATTTQQETTTEEKTSTALTTNARHGTPAPDYGDDDEDDDDCSWIDAGATSLVSGGLLLACAVTTMTLL